MTSMEEPAAPDTGSRHEPINSETDVVPPDGINWNGPASFWTALPLAIAAAIVVGLYFG